MARKIDQIPLDWEPSHESMMSSQGPICVCVWGGGGVCYWFIKIMLITVGETGCGKKMEGFENPWTLWCLVFALCLTCSCLVSKCLLLVAAAVIVSSVSSHSIIIICTIKLDEGRKSVDVDNDNDNDNSLIIQNKVYEIIMFALIFIKCQRCKWKVL